MSAQTIVDNDEQEATPVIVVSGEGLNETPSAAAYAVEEIDREVLIAAPSGRIEDALANIAGFQQFRRSDSRSANPSAQGATLRSIGGNATSRALVLLDGVPMSDPFFGYVPFNALAPERLAAVRVTRGGGSGPFGAGALTGTIELSSAGEDAIGSLDGRLLANDRGETEAAASLSTGLGGGFAVVSGRWDRGQGFYTTPLADRVPATARAGFDSWSAQLRAVAPLSDTVELQARTMVYDDRRTLRFDGADSTSEAQDASLRLIGRGKWQFDLLGYVQARNFSNVVISSTRFVPVLDQRNTPSTGLGGKFELRPPVGDRHVLRMGVDYRLSDGELFETAISAFSGNVTARRNAGGTNTDLGLFLEDDFKLGALTVTAGARLDRFTIRNGFYRELDGSGAVAVDESYRDRSGWETSFRGGVAYDLGAGLHVRAAAYTGLRLPTLNELYRPFVVFPVVTQANAELSNERLEGYEAGVDFAPTELLDLSLTVFDNKVKDAIANVTVGTNLRQRRNIDAIDAQGVEASARIGFGRFSLAGSLSYTDAKARGSGFAAALEGNRPSQTPKWAGAATLSYRPTDKALIAFNLRHIGAQFEADVLPAATTLGFYAAVPLAGPFSLILRGENLTDEDIVTRNQGGSIDLGAPRTIWAGVGIDL